MENLLFVIFRLTLFETIYITGSLIIIGIILGLIENKADFFVQRVFGRKGIMLTAWIGTPVHEFGHLFMCYLFRHKIHGFKLLDLRARNGVLGYVKHSWNQKSLYQNIGNFFIGMGPIFSGTAALVLGMYIFLPGSFENFTNYLSLGSGQLNPYVLMNIFELTVKLFKSIFSQENIMSLNFWVYFISAIGISSHMALSNQDLKGAGRGLVTIFTFILLINLVVLILNADISYFFKIVLALNVYLIAFSMISIVFSLIRLLLSVLVYFVA